MNFHHSREVVGMKTRIPRVFRAVVAAVALALSAVAVPQAAQAQAVDIAVLRAKVENTDSAIERIDKRLDRIDKRLDRMDERLDRMDERLDRMDGRFDRLEEIVIRLDERMNALQSQNRYIFGPLLLLLVASMFGLLTKGILWGVAREPQASSGASRPAQIPPQQFRPS